MAAATARQFEYLVCMVQQSRATFVNGQWVGTVPPSQEQSQVALESCPHIWDYLQSAGAEGWELVTSLDSAGTFQMLYFKRAAG